MMIIKISNESFGSVPVFPLQNVQLFPHTILPLQIFEPRYIDMIDYALEHDHLITIGDMSSYEEGEKQILGAGVIIAKQETAPKRYQILVQGVTRVQVIEEIEQTMAFRQVHAEILPDEEQDENELLDAEDKLRELLGHFAEANESQSQGVYELLKNAPSSEVLSHMIGANIVTSPKLRQALFDELNPVRRLDMIYEHVSLLLLNAQPTRSVQKH